MIFLIIMVNYYSWNLEGFEENLNIFSTKRRALVVNNFVFPAVVSATTNNIDIVVK